jgi:hypothetical protein
VRLTRYESRECLQRYDSGSILEMLQDISIVLAMIYKVTYLSVNRSLAERIELLPAQHALQLEVGASQLLLQPQLAQI